jgi:hypothetical protein
LAISKGVAASGSTSTLIKGALKLMAWSKAKVALTAGFVVLLMFATATVTINKFRHPNYNAQDFWATTYPSGMPEIVKSGYGHPLNYTFPITPIQGCSIGGFLDQCMQVSGNRYLVDRQVPAGSVQFGCPQVFNGEEWVSAFENALQTGTPEWWDAKLKRQRQENLVLIRYPEQRTILVLPRDESAKYQ